jgi:hypothetical protein
MKKISFMFLCGILMMFAAATTAIAQTGGEFGDGLTWEAVDGTLTITGSGAMPDFAFGGEQPWIDVRTSITTVTVGDGITHIGNYAFQYFTSLTDITIGSAVESIGNDIFTNCSMLTSVEIPESVLTIGNFAFSYSGITSAVIPDGVTDIGARCFIGCNALASVTLGSSLTDIGVYCFANCAALTEVTNRAATPQTIAAEHFIGVTVADAVLKVPAESLSDYQAAAVWSDFGTIMEISDGETYTIAATASPDEGGNVTGTGDYGAGTQATLTATPNTGYNFVNWTENGGEVSAEAEYIFEVTAARTLVANFALKTYTVSVTASPDGGGNVTGGGEYAHNEQATVTATANEGYEFVKWTENGMDVSIQSEYTFSVRNHRNLTANFTLQQFTVTFNTPEHGTLEVTAGGEPVASGSVLDYGAELVITATPDDGYELDVLTVNGAVFVSGETYLAVADVEIECTFKQKNVGIDGNTLAGITVYGNGNSVYIVNKNNIVLKSVQIADVLGRVVYRRDAVHHVSTADVIPVSGASGIYVVQLISDSGKISSAKVHITQ